MWRIILEKIPDLRPNTCTTDFEVVTHQLMRHLFPGIQIRTRFFFYFGRAVWRRVSDLELKMSYIQDENAHIFTKMLTPWHSFHITL